MEARNRLFIDSITEEAMESAMHVCKENCEI